MKNTEKEEQLLAEALQDSLRKVGNVWAPWRTAYIASHPRDGKCVFCAKAEASPEKDRENLLLERGKKCFVCMNAYPYTPGHVLILPYAHVETLGELDEETYNEFFALLKKWQGIVRESVGAGGLNIGINMGKIAGAGIAEHLHMHIVPRYFGDTNFITTCADTRVISRSLLDIYDLYLSHNPQKEEEK
ncbi:HIT domain-containing protein [bacterium]|nr:HIT domain-containing protein [bacterium]